MNPGFRLLCWRLYLDAYVDVGVSYQQKPFIRTGVPIWLCLCNNSSFDFQGKKINQGRRSLSKFFVPFFSLLSLDIWQWQWQRAPCMGGNLRIWKDTSKLSAARCCPMEGHQLLNATFFDPCLNLCLDQAGIKNTISQTSYLSFFLQVKVKEKGKSTCLSAGVDAEPKSTPLLSLLFPY